jgi:methionyl-tRNA synthetase
VKILCLQLQLIIWYAKPHIGHAFEKTLADVLARMASFEGRKVWFLMEPTRTRQKNLQAAKKQIIPVKDLLIRIQKLC